MLRFRRWLLSLPLRRRQRRPIVRPSVGQFRPRFDNLEDRLVPAGLPAYAAATGLGAACDVRVYDDAGEMLYSFCPFGSSYTGGVRLAVGDITGDGTPDVVAVSGPGGPGEIRVFDGGTARLIRSITAYAPTFSGGMWVALGDVTGDGRADVVVAPDAGDEPLVKVFDGLSGGEVGNFLAYAKSFTGGVRVAAADLNGDGLAEVITGAGTGGGPHVRAFDLATGKTVANFFAYQPSFTGGVFVAAGDTNGDGTADLVTGPDVGGGPHVRVFGGSKWDEIGNFMAGDSADRNGIRVGTVEEVDGTAADVLTGAGPTGAPVVRRYDGPTLNLESAALAFAGGMTAGVFVGGNVPVPPAPSIFINAPFPGDYREGTCPTTPGDEMDDTVNPEAGSLSDGGVRPIDGSVNIVSTDFSSGGFGSPWGFSRSFANNPGYVGDEANGRGWVNNQLPFLREDSKNNRLFAVQSGTRAFVFDETVGVYTAHFDGLLTMDHDTTNHRFVLTDVDGRVQTYYDFDSSHPSAQQGTLASYTDAEGNVSTVNRNGSGVVTSVGRSFTVSSTTYAESYVYTYYTSGVNADRLSSVALQRTVGGGSPTTIRTATYTYYDGSESYGLVGQLKTAVVADGSSNTLETSYYRYYETSQANGYDGGLRFVLGPTAYAQMVGDGYTPTTATDSQLDDYADHYFEYDADQRVTTHVVAGAGCSACTGGQGTYTYAYTDGANAAGYNSWAVQTVETLPDGSTNTYYSNAYGQVMLKSFVEAGGSDEWITFTMFDAAGRPLWEAAPSAMTGYDDAYADLVHVTSGNAAYVADSTGLVTAFTYDTTTTATTSTAGAAAGYLSGVDIQRGETGTAVPQSDSTFIKRTVGSIDLFFPAASTQYRNDNGTGGQTTSVAYTWQSGTFAPESITTTLPTVTTAQNGPNSATSMVTVFDSKGQPTWSKDPGGFLTYTEFDNTTGAVTKQITDVDTTQTGTFANLPSGWSTPGGGGLHLTTSYEVDALGRTTKVTYPNGRVDYTVFNDANHEVRYYPGWNSGTNLPTGPTTVSRDDRAGGYAESLTMSATPNVSSGRPTGTESIGSLQSLSRSYRNEAGQVVHSDAYFNLSGLTYSTAADIGTLNTHYYRTAYKTSDRGWAEKTTSPLGTITRQVYDDLGRVVSEWIGTDDTPTSGYWSPSNTSGTDLVVVREYEYDGGGVGDGNLTKVTEHPGLSQADRVTEFFYDWRNRQVAVKAGVEGSESTSLNRPISYTDYDNLGEVTKTRTYDGDAVTITSTGGVPNAPSSSLLRSQSTASYDELGRVYLSEVYTVDPSSGSVGSYTLKSNSWFDARGQVIKSSQPGGLVQKMAYDGAGRVTTSYTTDGGGDSGYGDADDVTGDNVLEQSETAYDSSGNVLSTTSRQRFHDETGTGALGTPTTGNHARVSYAAYYYDLADRPTATADYGTNGASSWTRASTVPTRSDTILVVSQTYDAAGRTYETTDPRGLVNRTTYDAFGRTTKTVENYVDGTVSDGDDKTTEYAYNAAGMTTLTAKLTGGGYQTTEWVYGVTTGGGNGLTSNDIVGITKWPNKTTGAASSSEQDVVTVDASGATKTATDRNGNVHTLSYDVLGRIVSDAVTTLGSGVDGSVRRIETAYDSQGNAYLITSYDAASGGSIVNQVQRTFNGLGQLITEYQSHSGAVNTSTTPKVQYAYSEMASGANHSRLTSMTYPNSRAITYDYGTGSGLNDVISRLNAIKDGGTTLEGYDYLGLGTVVRMTHPQPGVDLTYIKQTGESNGDAGDQYAGLDRFGRVVDQRWLNATPTDLDRYKYGYDRDGNRLYRENTVNTALSELYGYDGLNQVTSFDRGTLNGSKNGISGAASRTQDFDFDALGNWEALDTNGTSVSRTHDKQNELTGIGAATLTYDANGNQTTDETGKQFVWDAWNRLVTVKNSGGTTIETHAYDGRNYRVSSTASSVTTDFYYTAGWQVVEERVSGTATTSYVWSPVYVDAMIARDLDTDANGSLDERLYVMRDANFNVTGLVNTSGTVVERNNYDPFGAATVMNASWTAGSTGYAWVYLHQGTRWDGVAEKYYVRARWYDPDQGRWISTDPVMYRGGINLYSYEFNSPEIYLDSSGLLSDSFPRNPSLGDHASIQDNITLVVRRIKSAELLPGRECKVKVIYDEISISGKARTFARYEGDPKYDSAIRATKTEIANILNRIKNCDDYIDMNTEYGNDLYMCCGYFTIASSGTAMVPNPLVKQAGTLTNGLLAGAFGYFGAQCGNQALDWTFAKRRLEARLAEKQKQLDDLMALSAPKWVVIGSQFTETPTAKLISSDNVATYALPAEACNGTNRDRWSSVDSKWTAYVLWQIRNKGGSDLYIKYYDYFR